MWCPSVSLSVWANAWLAGAAAPDDVLDALSQWAPQHSVTAYDSVAAGRTGLPWPDLVDAGAVSLLQTLRTAAGAPANPPMSLVLPVPGDVRGLPAGTQFQRDAVAAGEAIVITNGSDDAIGLVPDFEYPDLETDTGDDADPCGLSWTAYSIPAVAPVASPDLGEAEYELRSAVRSAAEALATLRAGAADLDVDDPRGLVTQVLESERRHRIPAHAPSRALRVLENAAQVDAIVSVSAELIPIGLHSSSELRLASDVLQPLSAVVRSARCAPRTADSAAPSWREKT
ncbi:hypothetical protein A5633_10655 [Mycolicibacterium elephantis]|uniref:hypothetical protein n=1 Tax=Mycolicibacterium elephantis TaxID=81858 RepID=UPI0007EA9C73|nr:hypothetical protein [Mycolicibacterium elephantis]OBA86544.1 hypothetical protein A5633_10655 [Mycolicibacterium elephantis]